jgi:5'-methylthioadenosine phosphorylase
MHAVAIIGSTGLEAGDFMADAEIRQVDTAAGLATVCAGHAEGHSLIFLQRAYGRRGVPPHQVNYRANALALKSLGVQQILATSIVGSLTTTIPAKAVLVPDQFLDFTRRRDHTVFDEHGFAFVDMTDPYCERLRRTFIEAGHREKVPVLSRACYVAVDGPRYETRAEIEMFRRLGGDVIGMTNVPEVVMARELGMCYATLAFVSNPGAGIHSRPITRQENYIATLQAAPLVRRLLRAVMRALTSPESCTCAEFATDFVEAPH